MTPILDQPPYVLKLKRNECIVVAPFQMVQDGTQDKEDQHPETNDFFILI